MKPNVFIICTGVGHINRGYESFTTECFNALKDSDKFELYLLKGGGKTSGKELKISCVKRNSKLALFLSKGVGKDKYWVEEATFLAGMLPTLIKYRPAVIYYSDFILGTFLWHLRKLFNLKYKLLFSNGAPNGPPYKTEDHIQQLLPAYVKEAVDAGTPLDKQTMLPYAVNINVEAINSNLANKQVLRRELSLPEDKRIIICVGAINSHHKRIDYLVNEFALMNKPDYFLVVLGQIDAQSEPILEQAKSKLTNNNYLIKQVPGTEVMRYLCSADYFILPSLNEGLPRVLPEALSSGLLPIVHDYRVTRETLNDYGVFRDLTQAGTLQGAIDEVDDRNISKKELTEYALSHYSWQSLAARYEAMIVKCYTSQQ